MGNALPAGKLMREQLLNNSRTAIIKWAKTHFSEYQTQLIEKFFRLAEKADNNASQTRYFQAREELSSNRQQQERLFSGELNAAFNRFHEGLATHAARKQDHDEAQPLGLVDENKLNKSIAIDDMARKASLNCSEQIYALNKRFSALRGSGSGEQNNPIAPGVFAESLLATLAELQLDEDSQLIVLKFFDGLFMSKLNGLYTLLNQHFEDRGILPNLEKNEQSRRGKQQDSSSQTASDSRQNEEQKPVAATEADNDEDQASLTKQVELFSMISQLQQQLQQLAPAQTQAHSHTPLIASREVIDQLQQLQYSAGLKLSQLKTPTAVLEDSTKTSIKEAEEKAKQGENIDDNVIEIVGLLFEYMLNDEQLPDAVKTLLSYLHTPFLKVAINDREFFNHPQHPARQLLNNLVEAGERWVEPNGNNRNEVFLQIKAVIERILNEFDNDLRLFSELAFSFNQYLRQHSRRIKLAEKRSAQAAQGENKLKEIRLKVRAFIKKKVGKNTLPPAVTILLLEPWANFLSFNLLRYGSRSEQWLQAARTIDDILWFIQMPQYSSDLEHFQRFKALRKSLPVTLATGFEAVGYDSNQGNKLIKALIKTTEGTQEKPQTKAAEPIKADIDNMKVTAKSSDDSALAAIIETLKNTEFGTWFLLNADKNKSQQLRVKLAWSNTNTLHFMFVNRLGQQVAIKEGLALAEQIQRAEIKILNKRERKPFFEKSLERILQQLQKKRSTI